MGKRPDFITLVIIGVMALIIIDFLFTMAVGNSNLPDWVKFWLLARK